MKAHSPELITILREIGCRAGLRDYELGSFTVQYATLHMPEDSRPFPRAVAAAFPDMKTVPGQAVGAILVSDDVPASL